jgi:hypothetical protein
VGLSYVSDSHFLGPVVVIAVIVAVYFVLREARESIGDFAKMIRVAWTDEWRGKERVAKCNRGGTIISFTVLVIVVVLREAHSLIRNEHDSSVWIVCLFAFCVLFLLASLIVLAYLERAKLMLDRTA